MFTMMLIIDNEKERQILSMALKQRRVNVITSDPSYTAYNSIRQYKPDILLVELPPRCNDQLYLVKLLRKNKDTRKLPIWGYGWKMERPLLKGIFKQGVERFFARPLKFSAIVPLIDEVAKANNKELQLAGHTDVTEKQTQVDLLLGTETSSTKKVEIMSSHISKLLAFPFTVAQVMKLAQSEEAGAKDLARVILADPVITADLLKVANTVFFAGKNRRINSVRDAVVRIGFRETKRIVTAMSVMQLVNKNSNNLGFDRTDFWYHCLGCGIIAERLAKHTDAVSAEETFLAGLLHDFGIIVLDEFFPSIFSKLYTQTTRKDRRFPEEEQDTLRISHDQVVADVFEKWKFPDTIIQAVTRQYEVPRLTEDAVSDRTNVMSTCVYVSDCLAKSSCVGSECDHFVTRVPDYLLRGIRQANGFPPRFFSDVYAEVGMYRKFLRLEERAFPQREIDDAIRETLLFAMVNPGKSLFVPPRIFLDKEQIAYKHVFPGTRVETLHNRFDGMILWVTEDEPADTIAAYAAVTPRENGTKAHAGGGMPLFVFVTPQAYEQVSNHASPQCRVFSHVFDIRQLERAFTEAFMVQE